MKVFLKSGGRKGPRPAGTLGALLAGVGRRLGARAAGMATLWADPRRPLGGRRPGRGAAGGLEPPVHALPGRLEAAEQVQATQRALLARLAAGAGLAEMMDAAHAALIRRCPGAGLRLLAPQEPNPLGGWVVPVRGGEAGARLALQVLGAPPAGLREELSALADLVGLAAERERLRHELASAARTDALTGLHNRRGLLRRLRRELAPADRALGVLHLDLQRFREVNDLLGHAAGDELLRAVAGRLAAVLGPGRAARLGGDAFVALLECPETQVCAVLDALGTPLVLQGRTFHPSVSAGLGLAPAHGRDPEVLLGRAALAAAHARRQPPGAPVTTYHAELEAAQRGRVVEQDLRDALAHGGLSLVYQPQLILHDHRLCGLEALLRWNHPVHGAVPPQVFIALAEETGLIRELGHWALERAAAQVAAWRRAGLRVPVAVNLSAAQLRHADLVPEVQAVLERHGLGADALTLEITESLLLAAGDGQDDPTGTLRDLGGLGLRIAVDDFGTGYSNLSSLHRLPVHTLKIDQSFVQDLPGSVEAAHVVEAIIRLAGQLELHVLAEGIENAAQERALRELGCPAGQGFLFAPALSAEQVGEFLRVRPAAAALH